MKSPFPGMDPFLEEPAYWSDFHARFMNAWCEAIDDALPEHYEANLGEHVYLVEHEPEARKPAHPDIAVTRAESVTSGNAKSAEDAVATLEPVSIPLTLLDGPREAFIEILHRPDRILVAVLELLSPANKEQPGRTEYLAKRRALLVQQVHLIELDLLLGGADCRCNSRCRRVITITFCHVPRSGSTATFSPGVYGNHCRSCRCRCAPDHDIIIDLAAVFATAYERGRYRRKINYHDHLPRVPREEDGIWIQAILDSLKRQ